MIFLSYSRADAPLVEAAYEGLKARGVDVWMDRVQLRVGEPWLVSIASAIERADSTIVVSSQYSVASPHVRWEHEYAVTRAKKPVDVVRIDNGAPQLIGSPLETIRDLRRDPLDLDRWPPLHRDEPRCWEERADVQRRILPSYVRRSSRASVALLFRLAISLGVFSLFGFLGGSDVGGSLFWFWALYAPLALMVGAILWEGRRVYLLYGRRLAGRQNPILRSVVRVSEIVALVLIVWIAVAGVEGAGVAIVESVVEPPELPQVVWVLTAVFFVKGAAVLYRRLQARSSRRRSEVALARPRRRDHVRPALAMAGGAAIDAIRRALPSYDAYDSPILRQWLPAYFGRGQSFSTAPQHGTPFDLPREGRQSRRSLAERIGRLQLWFAAADRLPALILRSHLRTSLVDLREIETSSLEDGSRSSDDADLYLFTRYSRRFARRLRAGNRLLAVVTIGDSPLPPEISDLHCIDASNLDFGSAAETIDDTLVTRTPAVPSTDRDRRASFLRLPPGVFLFLVAYLSMQGLVAYELVSFASLEHRTLLFMSPPLLALALGWIPLVLTRRSALGLAVACAAAGVLLAGALVALLGSTEALGWLVIPGAWCAYQRSRSREAQTEIPSHESESNSGPRDIDVWAPRIGVRVSEWVLVAATGGAGLAIVLLT